MHACQIELDDKCKIFYTTLPVKLRTYVFEYNTFHGIKHDKNYSIHLVDVDHYTKFKVLSFMEDDVYFDNFIDAENFIFERFVKLREEIMREEDEVRSFIEWQNSKKRGSKKCT